MQHHVKRNLYLFSAVFIVFFVIVRLSLPLLAKSYINKKLSGLDGYSGEVEDVDLGVIRGRMGLNHLVIYKDSLSHETPIFAAKLIDMNIKWLALLRGGLVADVLVDEPKIQLIAESTQEIKKEQQDLKKDIGKAKPAVQMFADMFPIRVDSLIIHNGLISFKKLDPSPDINLFMSDIELEAHNLTNSKKLSDTMVANAKMTGLAMGKGKFNMELAIDPLARPLTFDVRSKLMYLPAETLNPVTKEYGKFDFERGSVSLIVEANVRKGEVDGYVKPLTHDLKISGPGDKKRDKDNWLRRFWEKLVGAAKEVVENQPLEQSGTRIPINGTLENGDADIWTAVVELLRNAYVKALLPEYEGT
jgi:hypothetical protein